jgi:CRP-like cAMP-binding protein
MAGSVLGGLAIFEGVEESELRELEAGAEEQSLGARQVVYQRDDACDGLYVVRSGGIVIRNLAVGQPIELVREVGPGEILGENEVLDGARRQFQARTLGPTRLLRLPLERLRAFLARHPLVETRLRSLSIYRRTARLHSLLAPGKRNDPRIRLDRAVELRPEGGPPKASRLEDLSHGGACLSSAPDSWSPGDTVRFTLALAGGRDLLRLEARVRWRMHDLVGLVFGGDPGAAAKRDRQIDGALRALLAAEAKS